MADILSLPASSPLHDLFEPQENYFSSYPSSRSGSSLGTVQRHHLREPSNTSLLSANSYLAPRLLPRNGDNVSPASLRSPSSVRLPESKSGGSNSLRSVSMLVSRDPSFTSAVSRRGKSDSESLSSVIHHRELRVSLIRQDGPEDCEEDTEHLARDLPIHSNIAIPATQLDYDLPELPSSQPPSPTKSTISTKAFRRWVSTLRRRKQKHSEPSPVIPRPTRWTLDDFDHANPLPSLSHHHHPSGHKKSDSWTSSIAFVAGVKSATVTLASASIAPLSRRASKWRRGQGRSSIVSGTDVRGSVDMQRDMQREREKEGGREDEAGRMRSRKRREKVEELIRTEEGYLGDLKALSNAYFTLLSSSQPSTSTASTFARSSAQRTLATMLHLHDELLGDLYCAVPFAEYDQNTARISHPPTGTAGRKPSHLRWHSVDVVPSMSQQQSPKHRRLGSGVLHQRRESLNLSSRSSEPESVVLRCAPKVVADVAAVFAKHIPHFEIYTDYNAAYPTLIRDIEETQRNIAGWNDFDRAIEALSASVNPVRSREANAKKALGIKDLLIKPIQRLPRYELLFADLARLTPTCDDLDVYASLTDVLGRLNQTCHSMNAAKANPALTRKIETTWLLGDRLSFASNQLPRAAFLQLLGVVKLCGCLHIAWRGKGEFVKGRYVVCVLFETTLLLATIDEEGGGPGRYRVLAGISLASATVEETDNGKGLQCHTAPHTWKLVFEHAGRVYEVILTACSGVEAQVWRSKIGEGIEAQVATGKNVVELCSPLVTDMRSVGKAFGKPGSFARRSSVRRTATVGPTTDMNQVIIKNTAAVVKDTVDSASASTSNLQQIPRSQSVAMPSHMQTLAPRRADRMRLEALLADVWSRDVLPYPGMTVRRAEQIRGSAGNVMRKFSMASITSNFSSSKRSASATSVAGMVRKEDLAPSSWSQPSSTRSRRPTSRLPLSDLLPTDFELQDQMQMQGKRRSGRRSALRAFTMTMERPFSPLVAVENRGSALRRAQSVREESVGVEGHGQKERRDSGMPAQRELPVLKRSVPKGADTPVQSDVAGGGEGKVAGGEREGVKTPKKSKSKRFLRLLGH